MAETVSDTLKSPVFPNFLAVPLGMIPIEMHSTVLAIALNYIFSRQISAGELDFLNQRILTINVTDAHLTFRITLENNQLSVAHKEQSDLIISGSVYDLLLLATGREDPDTLFFQRRLSLDGDTELGLYVKNFLNSQDLQNILPAPLATILPQLIPIYERLF